MRFFQLILCIAGLTTSAATLRAGTLAQFITPVGTILVELFDQDKPVTVQNFIRLTESGAYQNSFIHRADPDFVIQGGGYRIISNTLYSVPNFGTITNEYAIGPQYSNTFGTIAMAKVGNDPDSATSQWFFNLADNPHLNTANGGFTVFGRVIKGEEVLAFFNNIGNYNIYAFNDGNIKLPSLPMIDTDPYFILTQIHILNPEIRRPSDGHCCIDWITAPGVTNILETTGSLTPPDWQPIASFLPDHAYVATHTDTLDHASAYYRIRIQQ